MIISVLLNKNIATSLRPSKNFMYRKVFTKVNDDSSNNIVVGDLASNDCRNIKFFKSGKVSYWGLDFDGKILEASFKKNSKLQCVECNLLSDQLPKAIFDLVITTETIEHFGSFKDTTGGVINILNTLRSEGTYIVNSHIREIQDWLNKHLKDNFEKVTVLNYRNALSRKYEQILEVEGHIQPSKFKFLRLFHLIVNKFLVFIEAVLSILNISNSSRLYICEGFRSKEKNKNISDFLKKVNKRGVYRLNV